MPPIRPLLILRLRPIARPSIRSQWPICSNPYKPSLNSQTRSLPYNPRTYATHGPSEPRPYTFTEIQSFSSTPDPKKILIDVREPSELAATGRIPGAYSMPLTTNPDAFHLSAEDFFDRFGFEKPKARGGSAPVGGDGGKEGVVNEVIFYCKAGVRSRAAARLAREWEGVKVGDFKGGWLEWEGNGGESEKD